ncbi:hypothetical protein MB46_03265 [Arthrobacter alpinus]|nr:hypothetical protein MB46_03265 [Arthrobacter alpinus]
MVRFPPVGAHATLAAAGQATAKSAMAEAMAVCKKWVLASSSCDRHRAEPGLEGSATTWPEQEIREFSPKRSVYITAIIRVPPQLGEL